MEAAITDRDRATLVRAAVARVGREEMKAALARTNDPSFPAPKAVANALNALRKHRDPADVVTRPQYRAAVPYLASAVADACLSRTIEALGEHSDDPTREQLVEAIEEVRGSFSDSTIGVMLASVAGGGMPASDLCFHVATGDERFGLTDWAEQEERPSTGKARRPVERAATPRAARGPAAEEAEGCRGPSAEAGGGPEGRGAGPTGPEGTVGPRRSRSRGRFRRDGGPARGDGDAPPDPSGLPHPGRGSGIRPAGPLELGSGLRLGAVRLRRSGPPRARREVPALRGGGRVVSGPPGPAGLLGRGGHQPGLEVGAPPPLEAGRIRPAHLDRQPDPSGATAARRGTGGVAGSRGLERSLVGQVTTTPRRAAVRSGQGTVPSECIAPCNPVQLEACVGRASKR